MAANKNSEDEPVDFDDLLADEPVAEAVEEAAPVEEETPEQRRIRELEALVAAPEPVYADDDDAPLTPEQIRIQELEDQLAQKQAAMLERAPAQYDTGAGGEKILIHVLQDGFIAQGEVWYRGQELEFDRNGIAYKQTKDRNGNSWVDLAGDVQAQYDKWGKQYLGEGPFRGLRTEKFEDEIAQSDLRRKRAVPLIGR